MSKAAKASAAAPSTPVELPFEEALQRLESIVEAMESDDLPLEALLTRFEEGTRLARVCQARLAEAEQKIRQLERTAGGDLQVTPLAQAGMESE